MSTRARRALSHVVGWLADRRIPRRLRAPIYRGFARFTGADLAEARPPLDAYPSLGAFFVRRLVDGARPWPQSPDLLGCPSDGRIQAIDRVTDSGSVLQAKGQPYALGELLGSAAEGLELAGAWVLTVYLSPRDYHRVHCPLDGTLEHAAWSGAERFSVAPAVLARRPRVFVRNERVALRLTSDQGPYALVLVGALNVGRLRVVGLEPGAQAPMRRDPRFARGEELGRFEMGSTVVLVLPPGGWAPLEGLRLGQAIRLGEPLAKLSPT
jgi:phosphatidylserine decarboxylase